MGKKRNRRERAAVEADAPGVATALPPPPVARPWLWPLVSFAGLLILYVVTLAPSVGGGDSGELIAASATGGAPHPPGYPVYALLARLCANLPFGPSPAWRVNLLSAVSTAGAGALVCATVQAWTAGGAAGLLAAALLGTNPLVWHYATCAEVFGLNAFFVALAFFLWLGIERAPSRARIFVLALASGLAMGNHHTYVFVGAPLLLRSLWVARRQLGGRGLALALGCGVLGLAPYGYLGLASASDAAMSWGDQTTLDGLLHHVLRRDYGTFSLGKAGGGNEAYVKSGTFLPTLWHMFGGSLRRLLVVGPLFALLGHLLRRTPEERRLGRVLAVVLLGYALIFAAMSNMSSSKPLFLTVLSRFFIQLDLMLALGAGVGFALALRRLQGRAGWTGRVPALALAGALAVLTAGIAVNARAASQRGNTVFRDFVHAAFASLPANAIVVTMGDHLSGAVFYLREVEKLRPDVIHLDKELLGYPWYCARKRRLHPDLVLPRGVYLASGWKMKQLMDANPGRPLTVMDRLPDWDQSWKDGYKLATVGLVHHLVPAHRYPSFEEWERWDRREQARYHPLSALRYPLGSWEQALGELALNTQAGRASLALYYATQPGAGPGPARTAVRLLEEVVRLAGGEPTLGIAGDPTVNPVTIHGKVFKNLGIAYEALSRSESGHVERTIKAFQLFVARAEEKDPDLPAARDYLRQAGISTGR